MRVPLESDPVALAVYRWWTDVPDWRNAGAYPARDTLLQWFGMEFMRRREEFRRNLRDVLETLAPEERKRLAAPEGKPWSDPVGYLQKACPEWPSPRFWPRFASVDDIIKPATGRLALTFNLRDPIEPQLERAGEALRQWQQGHVDSGAIPPVPDNREHRDLLPSYLRVLDAKEKGTTHREIADTLHGEHPGRSIDENRVSKLLKSARQYRDLGYITLLREVI
jgi:hypothetical protein